MTPGCANVRERLDAFADRELDPNSSAEVARHLAECPDCVQELNTIRLLRSRLRAAVVNEPVPEGLLQRISSALHRERPPVFAGGRRSWAPLAAAAMIAIAFGVSWSAYRIWSGAGAADLAADRYTDSLTHRFAAILRVAMTDHIHCAVFRAYPANPPPRARMASDIGPRYENLIPIVRARVPDRFRLEQAHRCTVSGRDYVHMIFRDRAVLISLIATIRRPGESLAELPLSGGTRVRTAAVDQYQVAAFDAGPFLAYVVSDMPQPENTAIAAALADPLSSYLTGVSPVRIF